MKDFYKYPRTQHLQGSRLQAGDEDLTQVPFSDIKGRYLVAEEKIDGGNCGISFDEDGSMMLQSRGHPLRGGPRERQFGIFKSWAATHQNLFFDLLDSRYILYGEWLFAKHSEFYDALPHYFLEFDIFDKETETFFSTTRREEMIKQVGADAIVKSVPILGMGEYSELEEITSLIGDSLYKTAGWEQNLLLAAQGSGLDVALVKKQTDMTRLSEGLYIKVEEDGKVTQRLKFVRRDFVNKILDSDSHWMDRPILPNQLKPGVDLYATT